MAISVSATLRFFFHLARDLAGTLRQRWKRFYARVVNGEEVATVGVDIFPFFHEMTGIGWYEWNLLAALDERDDGLYYNLYGHTFLAPEEPPAPEIPGTRHMRLRLYQLPVGFMFPIKQTIWVLRRTFEPLLRFIDKNDVAFAPNFFVPRSQLPYGRTTVATVHDLAFKVMPESVSRETLAALTQNLPGTLYRCERLVAVSDATAKDVAEHLEVSQHRIHTIHEGLDPRFSDTAADDDAEADDPDPDLPERYLLFVSTLEPRKNVNGVLAAFRLLVEWGYPGSLILVGRWGWRTEQIKQGLEASPVKHRIVHLNYVKRELLPRLYRRADALLFPSWLEGFGLPLLEAMACGAPVVTSGTSAMPEVAGPAAVYVDPASAHGIASAVDALLADPGHRQRLIDLGYKRVARFSWQRAAAATAQVLRQAARLPVTGDDEYRV
jgi:glycosyltransferase involved in cell wall biosynthesis